MSPLAVVVLIVLVDLLGFTVVMPLLPRFAEQYDLEGWQIGLLFSTYPLCQLIAGPILGRLSDRFGRRPILIVSQAGTALSFVMLGLAHDFPTMLLARAVDGASGGNILVAQAYVADVTTPENRARGLGLIGMAFGLGFVLGPLLGGVLVDLPLAQEWRLRLPFFVGAVFSTVAWVLVLTHLPESLRADPTVEKRARILTIHGLVETLTHAASRQLVGLGFLVTLAFASLEGSFSLYLEKRMAWGASRASFGFAFLGFVSAVVQGLLIRRLVPRFGETRLIVAGASALVVGLAALAGVRNVPALVGATLTVAMGQGLLSPSISGLLSRRTPPTEQGAIFGTYSSAQTLARMVSYSLANILLARLGTSAPFWLASVVAIAALSLGVVVARQAPVPFVEPAASHG
jgi:DHA1 family tetracycline resistance protein-like MFS transporter